MLLVALMAPPMPGGELSSLRVRGASSGGVGFGMKFVSSRALGPPQDWTVHTILPGCDRGE